MNSDITILDAPPITEQTKTILSKDGFTCSLIQLAPGEETQRRQAERADGHILYVAEGRVTVRFGEVNTILSKDQALLVSKDCEYVIAANTEGNAKVLRVEIPPMQLLPPQIITLSP